MTAEAQLQCRQRIAIGLVALGCSWGAEAAELLEVYTAPKALEIKSPSYPYTNRIRGSEGWVNLNFMVSPQGEPYEITVTGSTGDSQFEDAAIKAMSKSRFAPAHYQGVAIDAGMNYKVAFRLNGGQPGARSKFVRKYKRVIEAIDGGDRTKADAIFAEITEGALLNLYEDAYLALAQYRYLRQWGNAATQLRVLRRAVAYEDSDTYLPGQLFTAALRHTFALEVESQDFSRALKTARTLRKRPIDETFAASLNAATERIEALRSSDQSYAVTGEIGPANSWYFELFRDAFYFSDVQGELAEVKLRCDRKYVFFRYQPEQQYTLAPNLGGCYIEVVGNPKTTFKLVQPGYRRSP